MHQEGQLKVLLGCILFQEFTGSELYVYELAKKLHDINCNVTIISPHINGPLTKLAQDNGIEVYDFNNIPNNRKFDIIHCQHKPIVQELVRRYPNTRKVCSIHSEVISLEDPFIDVSIHQYIAVRPEIKTHLENNFNINSNIITVVYNPIDETRFKMRDVPSHNSVLFVGTIDYLRKDTIYDLVEYTKNISKDLWLVGKDSNTYLSDLFKNKHVKYSHSCSTVEKYVQCCDETAGIQLGRTTIEGWMCNKPGWIYKVNNQGNILNKTFTQPPEDISKFYAINVAKQIKDIYLNVLK